ncbi:MAG: class I SAM-dependent DNA methyltransferase, partial [Paludibacter sp.]|nr:class I SAM-dependent DNA methyltransferase [Paludibacter sp.]
MVLNILNPRKALNKAFLKVKAGRSEVNTFKENLIYLLDNINESESEEFHKKLISRFLEKTYYENTHFVNTKGRNDLVIHNGISAANTVGVIIEAKKPTNKGEMMTVQNINSKAFQELVLYYLRERITHKNLEIKQLIATNIYEWFIFDAHVFEKEFAQNKTLVIQFIDFEEGRSGGYKTDFFYNEIAAPAIEAIKHEITFTHFDIRNYEKPLRNTDAKDD